jgi:ComF family protein
MGLLSATLDVLLPTDCAGCGLPRQRRGVLCSDCLEELPLGVWALQYTPDGCDTAVFYGHYDGPAGTMVRRAKYRPDPGIARELGKLVSSSVDEQWPALDAVVPVPQTRAATLSRGFSPVRIVAEALARALDVEVVDALERRTGRQQAGLPRAGRLDNARRAYRATAGVPGRVLLVDDVVTSGATAATCAYELIRAGADEVHLLAICDARA